MLHYITRSREFLYFFSIIEKNLKFVNIYKEKSTCSVPVKIISLIPGKRGVCFARYGDPSAMGEIIIPMRRQNVKTQKRRKKAENFVETYDFEKGGEKNKKST